MDSRDDNEVLQGESCFALRHRLSSQCPKSGCRYWIDNPETQNCSLVAATTGGMTLEQIGQIFGLTRMRVCQIEKSIYKKISHLMAEDQPLEPPQPASQEAP